MQELLQNATSEVEYHLQKLHYWLKYGSRSSLFLGGVLYFPFAPILGVLRILAFVFSPYLIWRLVRAGWYKQVAAYVLVVVLPFVASWFIGPTASISGLIMGTFPLLAFYFYTWILGRTIGQYLSEQQALRLLDVQRQTQ